MIKFLSIHTIQLWGKRGAMFSFIEPEAVATEGGIKIVSFLSESYATSKNAMTFLKMTGKGMTLKKKWEKYRHFKRTSKFLIKVPYNERNIIGIRTLYNNSKNAKKIYEDGN